MQALEKLNPTKAPLASPLINGKWELVYTTSASVVGSSKPAFLRPSGPIYQYIGEPPPFCLAPLILPMTKLNVRRHASG